MNKNWVPDQQFVYLCIMELYLKWKAVSQDSLELISNPFWFKMLDSAMTRTFGNRQRSITAVGTYLSGLPPAKSKLTQTKNVLYPEFIIGLSKWLQGCSFTISPQISNYSNSTCTALEPNFKRNMPQQPKKQRIQTVILSNKCNTSNALGGLRGPTSRLV